MKKTNNLKCCPFCGCKDVSVNKDEHSYGYFVECSFCGACTAIYDNKMMAIMRWNDRLEGNE